MATRKSTITGASLLKQKDQAKGKKQSWESLWQTCLDYADPAHDGITSIRAKGDNVSTTRLIDICMRSNLTYASGMYSFLCNGDWLRFSSSDSKDRKDASISGWWDDVSMIVLNKIETSNFKDEIIQYFKSLGSIGTACMLTEYIDGELCYRFFDITEYAILEDNKKRVDSVFRELKFSAKQAIQEFGYDKVADRVRKAFETNSDEIFTYSHIVQPRINRKKTSASSKEMPFASYYIEDETKKILKEGGFDSFPYAVCRLDKSRNEIYGRSPMSYSIATANILQYYEETFMSISDRKAHPNWLADRQSRIENLTSAKDGVTTYDSRRGNPPSRLVEEIDLNFTMEDRLHKEKAVEQAFFVDLFDALKDYRNMTATETNERVSSSISRIAPIVSRILNEGLRNITERTFLLLLANNYLPEIPDGYEVEEVKATFYGRLSMLTEELELNNMSRGVNFILQYAEALPQMLDWINQDELAKLSLLNSNAPSKILNSEQFVTNKRSAQAKQVQQAEQMQMMNASADMIGKTSKTPEGGSPAEKLMEQMP